MDRWTSLEGSPSPLGATWVAEEQAYNFALYSRNATSVKLLLFSADDYANPMASYQLCYLRNKSGHIWHCRIPAAQVPGARYYAYQVDGPNDPGTGNRFDPDKYLLDPYAQTIFFPPQFSRQAAREPGSNAGKAPLGLLPGRRPPFDWGDDRPPRHTHDIIIYELHVRGFTKRPNSGVSPQACGTFAGLIEKIPYLQELGVTAVELMPVFQYDPDEGNYWGYMPLSFFAPHHAYASAKDPEQVLDEFRTMVKALHAANIEVILDVVYNHTTEQDHTGPTYSYRGIDNASYYMLEPDMQRYRTDLTGTGNVFRVNHPAARDLILDSLRFWVTEMHVDGFRFDLASVFLRNQDGTVDLEDPAIISEISTDPDFARVRLIAEPWDLASYHLGYSFPGLTWQQWNGKFRDDVRAFVRGDAGKVGALMTRLYGSDDLFPDSLPYAYHPYQSVNFVTSHDGFCLYDLVSYNCKHNLPNGHNNTDGTDYNLSWNCGWEGDVGVPAEVLALRQRQMRNFCCLLLLSNGTPMIFAGDEFANTQRGNNNPYNQDNETTWLDWDRLQTNAGLHRFFRHMIAFRKAHPSLCRSRFWRDDVRWYGASGPVDTSHCSHSLAFCVHGASQEDVDIYVMINGGEHDLEFTIQEGHAEQWRRVVDTSLPSPDDICEPGSEMPLDSLRYLVKSRSVVVLCQRNES